MEKMMLFRSMEEPAQQAPPLKDSEPKKLGWNAVERVIPHHLKHDVQEHPTKVNGSNKSQTAPKLLKV